MPVVTGNLSHIGGERVPAGVLPEIEFYPSEPAILTGGVVVYSRPVVATITNTSDGSFEVDLLETDRSVQDGWFYRLRLRWMNPDGYGTSGYTVVEFPNFELYVPAEGGSISDLGTGGGTANPVVWWVSEEPPTNPAPNTYWLNPSTGDVKRWE